MRFLLSFLDQAEERMMPISIDSSTLFSAGISSSNIECAPSSVHTPPLQAVTEGSRQEHCHLLK